MARLKITSGPRAGDTVEVKEELVIGREDCDLEVADLEMSRRHAVVRRATSRLEVEDLGSRNGTFVDGKRIEEPTPVGGGAEIRVGTTVLVVEGVLPVSQPPEAPPDSAVTRATEIPPEMRETKEPVAAAAAGAQAAGAAPATPAAQTPAAAMPAPPSGPVGEFRPPERRRQRGLASRSWIPTVLSFGTVVLTAVALVLYFALR
jgi:pSer/pThr/pTyr-binding forkhead associated (FHA) protein